MHEQPQKEHHWLEKLVGAWEGEFDMIMGPDQPPMKSTNVENIRSIGGLWTLSEATLPMPDEGQGTSLMTLGYDPKTKRFVGTFIASMMSHLWVYSGSLDATGKILTLDAEGPSFTGEGTTKYQDIIEFVDDNHRIFRSKMLGEGGAWLEFMVGHNRRK